MRLKAFDNVLLHGRKATFLRYLGNGMVKVIDWNGDYKRVPRKWLGEYLR